MKRRTFIQSSAVAMLGASGLSSLASTQAHLTNESPLIYLSPIKSNGALSRCQAEVWYVAHDNALYVVTDQNAWRARAVSTGLTRTQVWVGDVGQWRSSDGRYKALPALLAQASIEQDPIVHATLLTQFGSKYAAEWSTWGPRFKNGLADGSRVMLKYQPA